MRRLDEARLAVMFLTRLPVGTLRDAPPLPDARWAFPLVGLLPGVAGWAGFTLAGGATGAVLAVLAMVLVTGALHHDALADYADGMGGGRDRERVLDIMRDSRIGAYGVLALILCVGLVASSIHEAGGLAAFLFLGVASRLAMLVVMNRLPPARSDGLGRMSDGRGGAWPGMILTLLLMLPLGWPGIAALLAVGAAGWAIGRVARRRIGGHTGDVLGAVQLASETAGWVVLAALA